MVLIRSAIIDLDKQVSLEFPAPLPRSNNSLRHLHNNDSQHGVASQASMRAT
jgi:hypothetical protein